VPRTCSCACTPSASPATSSTRCAATAASNSSRRSSRSRARGGASSCTWRRKLRTYELQERGLDTVEANAELGFPADAREYGIGNQILADLGLTTIRILTNNPKKLTGIDGFGLTVVEQVAIEVAPNAENRRYLAAKRDKLGHVLHHQDLRTPDEESPTT